jgi:hypothetical protein
VLLALILGVASKWPRQFFFIGAISYFASGPLVRLWSIAFPSRKGSNDLLETAAETLH